MADSIEDIIIEIESDSSAAASQIDTLTARLQSLKKATGNSAVLSTFSKNLESLNRSLNFMNSIDSTKVNAIRNMAAAAGAFKGVTISKSIGEQIAKINESLAGLSPEGQARFLEFVNSVMPLAQLKGFRYPSGLNSGLANTAKLAEELKDADFTKLRELVEIISQLNQVSNVDGSGLKQMATSMKSVSNAANSATKRTRQFNTVLANIRTKTVALYMVLRRVQAGAMKAMTTYGDYVESLNLYKMALGEAAKEEYEFAEEAQRILGIDLTQWMKAQGVFSALASGFGVASDKAALMSRNLTQLAYDISSFYNIDVESAIEKVQSGFAGQIRPVRNLGYDLSQTRLQAIALANGIDKDVQSMSQAEKSQLRYVALLTQLTEVQGDLARTIDSPINQMRLLNAQIDQMQRSIGMVLLPILNKLLPYLNAIFRVIKMIADEIAAMFGYTLPRIADGDWSASVSLGAEDLEENLEDATGAAEKLKNTLASFDQINLITSSSGGSGSGKNNGISGTDLGIDLPSYDFLGGLDENAAQKLAQKMRRDLEPFVQFVKDAIMFAYNHIDQIKDVLETLAVFTIGKTLFNSLNSTLGLTGKLAEGFNALKFITIGITLSYMGGGDLAKGDIFGGILKSAIGTAAAMYGFSAILGPGGLVLGLGVSLMFNLAGYNSQKEKEFIKQCDEIFFTFREGRQSVEDFTKTWDDLIASFSDPELTEKIGVAKALEGDVQRVGESVSELQREYVAGNIASATYASNLTVLYSQMADTIEQKLEASGEAIRTFINGDFGDFLRKNNVIVENVNKGMDEAETNIKDKIQSIRDEMDKLNVQLRNNGISQDEYNEKMDELGGRLNTLAPFIKESSAELNKFQAAWSKEINFESWDQMIELTKKVGDDYTTTMKRMQEEHDALYKDFKVFVDNYEGEYKEELQRALDLMPAYLEEQEKELTDAYKSTLKSIEDTGYINWLEVYNTKGLDGVLVEYQQGVGELNDLIQKSYDDIGEIREKNAMTYSASLLSGLAQDRENIKEIEGGFLTSWVNLLGKSKQFGGTMTTEMDEMYGRNAKIADDYFKKVAELYGYDTTKKNAWMDSINKGKVTLNNAYNESLGTIKKYTNDGTYYESLYTKAAAQEMDMRNYIWENGTLKFVGETELSASAYRNLGYLLGDESVLVDPLYSTMMSTADVMGSPSVLNAFAHGADTVMGKVSSEIYGSKNAVQKAYFGALEVPTQKVVDLGGGLGLAIAKGMKDTAPEIQKSTQYAMGTAAKEVNKFGDGLGDFFRDIAKAFNDSFAGGLTNLFGSTSTYTPPKIKTPKIRGYASGGFPNSADFFYANENGKPEFVGTMGGRTAVANNQEITKGVADGVYRAIKETGLLNDVKKIANKNGNVVFAPSEEAGRVMTQSVNLYSGTGGRY